MVVGFITTYAINEFKSQSGEVYSIQNYVIKFVSDLRQVKGFLWVLWFPPPIKLTNDITEKLLKVTLNTTTLTPPPVLHNIFCILVRIVLMH